MRQLPIMAIAVLAACQPGSARRAAMVDDVPKVTRDFLKYCKTHVASCHEEIASIIVTNDLVANKTFCFPSSARASRATYAAANRRVIKWLADHPEKQDEPTQASIKAAHQEFYPCPGQ